jgi:hypothetical protein
MRFQRLHALLFFAMLGIGICAIPRPQLAYRSDQPRSKTVTADLHSSGGISRVVAPAQPFDTYLGQFRTVEARSSSGTSYPTNFINHSLYGNVSTGYRWECVEFMRRFYISALNLRITSLGDGFEWFELAPKLAYMDGPTKKVGFDQFFDNTVTRPPAAGDILAYDNSIGGGHGHVAIVKRVRLGYILTAQQNWHNESTDLDRRLPFTSAGGRYHVEDNAVQGWIRPSCVPKQSNAKWHPNGTLLVESNGAVWLIEYDPIDRRQEKRLVPDEWTFVTRGWSWCSLIGTTTDELKDYETGEVVGNSERVIRRPDGAIFRVNDRGYKQIFASMRVFDGLGYSMSEVEQAGSNAVVDQIPDDPAAPRLSAPFPEGTLVAKPNDPNGAVYVITDGGRRGLASALAFQSLGYDFNRVLSIDLATFNAIDDKGSPIDECMVTQNCGGIADELAPTLSITSHNHGQTITTSSATISGTASDAGKGENGIGSVTINGVRANGDTAAGSGTANWSLPVQLVNGQNTIRIVATDESPARNATTVTFVLNFQPTNPTVNYIGYLDVADCNIIAGWAADKNRPNTSITVGIYADNQLVQTVTANGSRPDVGSVLGDNGLHGFNIPTPASLKNNGAHTITARFESGNTNLANTKTFNCSPTPTPTPTPSPVLAASYSGYLDVADCNIIAGWAADKNRPNTSITVGIYADNQLVQTVTANGSRPDVGSVLGDNGLHGFNIPTPASLKNNGAHTITARFESGNTNLANTKTFNCSPTPTPTPTPSPVLAASYSGYLDVADCNIIAGWAADKNRPNTSITVGIYADNQLVQTVTANGSRPDVGSVLGDNGLHGFNIPTPAILKNSGAHNITARFESGNTNLANTKTFNCSPTPTPTPTPTPSANYVGYFDFADCNQIYGWAADRNRPNTPINIGIYDGSTLIATVSASGYRSDVGTLLGDNGFHGFTIATPQSLKNGQSHSISARFENSSTNLANSPKALSCSTAVPPSAAFTFIGAGRSGTNNEKLTYLVPVGGSVNFNFDGSPSSAGTGSITSYDWRISTTFVSSLSSFNFTLGRGSHFTELRVMNSSGLTNSANATIVISEVPRIDSISPAIPVHSSQDRDININGINFQTNLTVRITFPNGDSTTLSGTQIRNVNPNSFVMRATLGNVGLWKIRVDNPDGGQSNSFPFNVQ